MRLVDQCKTILRIERGEIPPDSRLVPDPPSEPEMPFTPRRVSPVGIALIKRFEGIARVLPDGRIAAYPDPATGGAPWTIGWGSTGPDIGPNTIWTLDQCNLRFNKDLKRYAADVIDVLGDSISKTSQYQFDALVSFHYNTGAIRRATLTGKHKACDYKGAAREFTRWVYAGGRKMKGLVRRRKAERDLYLRGTK